MPSDINRNEFNENIVQFFIKLGGPITKIKANKL